MIAVRLLVDGVVVREVAFRETSFVIGRGTDCDFAIVDPSVSRQHARVSVDPSGAAWIDDLGSRNGLRIGNERVERAALPAAGTVRCRLGATEVELAVPATDATVELAAPAAGVRGPLRSLKAMGFWAAVVAASVALVLIGPTFWSPWEQNRLTRLSWVSLVSAVASPIVAFVLIGLLRIVGRKVHLSDSLRALALVAWGWVLLTLLAELTTYGLSVGVHRALSALLGQGGLMVTVAYLASVARPGPRRRFFLTWAAAMAVLVAAFAGAGRLAVRQAGVPQLDYDVRMPIAGVTGPVSDLDRYLDGVRADFAVAGRRAEEERRSSEAAAE